VLPCRLKTQLANVVGSIGRDGIRVPDGGVTQFGLEAVEAGRVLGRYGRSASEEAAKGAEPFVGYAQEDGRFILCLGLVAKVDDS
jgi:hypothetical protein